MQLPEAALRRRGLGGLGRRLRVRVDVVERQVAPDVAQLVAEGLEQLADDDLRLTAVAALVVPVLDEGDGRRLRAADVVARRVHVVGEVQQIIGRARDLARPPRGRDPGDHPTERHPAHERRQQRGAEHAQLRLVELPALERDARDQQRDGEADARDGSTPGDHRPAQAPGQPAEPRHDPGRGGDADRLADHVAEDDPQRDRRGEGVAQQVPSRRGCRRSRARTAARSRSSSTDAGGTGGARSPRSRRRRCAAPSAPAAASAARGRSASARWRARGRCARADTRS